MGNWYGSVFTLTLAINAPLLARAIWYTASAIQNEGMAKRLEAETAFIRAQIDQEKTETRIPDVLEPRSVEGYVSNVEEAA